MNHAELRRYYVEKIMVSFCRVIPEYKIALRRTMFDFEFDIFTREWIASFSTYIHGLVKERIQVDKAWPRTWWDAFKARWFPDWLLVLYPAEYDSIHIDQPIYLAVCPHLDDDTRSQHLSWISQKKDEQGARDAQS